MPLESVPLSSVVELLHFTPGRRLYTYDQVSKRAATRDLPTLMQAIEAYADHDRSLLELRARYRSHQAARAGDPALVDLDNRADRLLGAIYRDCRDGAVTYDPAGPLRALAARLVAALFPGGVQPFTTMSFVEQHAEMTRLVKALREQFTDEVTQLGLGPKVHELTKITVAYGERLDARPADVPEVTWDAVRAADAEGQQNLEELVARILGRFPTRSAEDGAARTELLGPILTQQEAIRAYYRGHRRVRDVDPESGQELPDEPAPGEPEAPTPGTPAAPTPGAPTA